MTNEEISRAREICVMETRNSIAIHFLGIKTPEAYFKLGMRAT